MAIYEFNSNEQLISIDQFHDSRSDIEKENTLLAKYNHARNDLALAERHAEEIINISGAPIIVYKRLMTEHAKGTIEALWEEERLFTFDEGTWVKGTFKVEPLNMILTKYGVDSPLKLNCSFSRAILMKIFGENLIRIGDVLRIPYNISGKKFPHYFSVENAFDSSNYQYRWLYWTTNIQLINNEETIRPFIEYDKKMGWL